MCLQGFWMHIIHGIAKSLLNHALIVDLLWNVRHIWWRKGRMQTQMAQLHIEQQPLTKHSNVATLATNNTTLSPATVVLHRHSQLIRWGKPPVKIMAQSMSYYAHRVNSFKVLAHVNCLMGVVHTTCRTTMLIAMYFGEYPIYLSTTPMRRLTCVNSLKLLTLRA